MSGNPIHDDSKPSSAATSSEVKSYSTASVDEVDYYENEIEKHMQASLDSTERSLQHLENSERLGISTAQELLEQREKLENAERNLDGMHSTMQQSQRHLNSLKGVFSGFFKNIFSRKPAEAPAVPSSIPMSKSADGLTVDMKETEPVRGDGGTTSSLPDSNRAAMKGTRWETMDDQIDQNLDLMSSSLSNLRSLGTALGTEIDDQNEMADRIQTKVDRMGAEVRKQDNQAKEILGYTTANPAKK